MINIFNSCRHTLILINHIFDYINLYQFNMFLYYCDVDALVPIYYFLKIYI